MLSTLLCLILTKFACPSNDRFFVVFYLFRGGGGGARTRKGKGGGGGGSGEGEMGIRDSCLGAQEDEEEDDRLADVAEDWANAKQHWKENKGNPDASDPEFGPSDEDPEDEEEKEHESYRDAEAPEVPAVHQSVNDRLKEVANSMN